MRRAEEIERLAGEFFAGVKSFNETSRRRFQSLYGISTEVVKEVLPKKKWVELKKDWARSQFRRGMDEVFKQSLAREHFSIPKILACLEGTNLGRWQFMELSVQEWEEMRMSLPTAKERVLATIREMVSEGVASKELSWDRVLERSKVMPKQGPWFREALRTARRELLGIGRGVEKEVPPDGVCALSLPGGWIDMDADVWDLRSARGALLHRDKLRADIASIGWAQLREDLLDSRITCLTATSYHQEYRWAGELLGAEVPDIRQATLERVQRAWVKYTVSPRKKQGTRSALMRLFARLSDLPADTSEVNLEEMLRIATWLYTMAAETGIPDGDFLSEAETIAVIEGCLLDVRDALDFTENDPDLLALSTRPYMEANADPVVRWAVALMLLLMLFTGLRRQSVIKLEVGDWAELRRGLFALVWRHGKKREEKVAVIAATLALMLNEYVLRTNDLRRALNTQKVFLIGDHYGYWNDSPSEGFLFDRLKAFIKRHNIFRGGRPLQINCLMLRRTHVTRRLYEGISIWALRLQLGHESIWSTRRYGKFDLYEHPAEVGPALDKHGKQVLVLWRNPILLNELDAAEKETLLGVRQERRQSVGLCRQGRCLKMEEGAVPPCSLCEHLVTGPEFIADWESEKLGRELEIEKLVKTRGADRLVIHKKYEYEVFCVNFRHVKEGADGV